MISKPKVLVTSSTTVPTLLGYYKNGFITLDDLCNYFNTVVVWQHRDIMDSLEWTDINTWRTVYNSIDDINFTSKDYFYVIEAYEKYVYEQSLEDYKGKRHDNIR